MKETDLRPACFDASMEAAERRSGVARARGLATSDGSIQEERKGIQERLQGRASQQGQKRVQGQPERPLLWFPPGAACGVGVQRSLVFKFWVYQRDNLWFRASQSGTLSDYRQGRPMVADF